MRRSEKRESLGGSNVRRSQGEQRSKARVFGFVQAAAKGLGSAFSMAAARLMASPSGLARCGGRSPAESRGRLFVERSKLSPLQARRLNYVSYQNAEAATLRLK